MNKNTFGKLAVVVAIAAAVIPGAALAHGSEDNRGILKTEAKEDRKEDKHLGIMIGDNTRLLMRFRAGTVSALQSNGFSAQAKDGTTFTVITTSATLKNIFGKVITLADIKVGDSVGIKGVLNGTTVTAATVIVTPAKTHPASAKGTVTAVSGSTLTVQTNNHGVISNVTVNTSADTKITKQDGTAGTTADAAIGTKVKVRGLWDEVLNVLNAVSLKLRIK